MKWFVLTLCLVCTVAVAEDALRVSANDVTDPDWMLKVQVEKSYSFGNNPVKLTINAAEDTLWVYDKNMVVIIPDTLTVKWTENIATFFRWSEPKKISEDSIWVTYKQTQINEEYQLGLRSDGVVVWREKK